MCKQLLFHIIALAACAWPGICSPAANVSLAGLLAQADAVVVAVVVDASTVGSDVNVTISVTRPLTGSLTAVKTVSAVWSPTGTPSVIRASSDIGASGIWFLKQVGAQWAVLPIAVGTVPLSQIYFPVPAGPMSATFAYVATASPQAKLAWEVAAAVDAGSGPTAVRIAVSGALDGLGSTVLAPVWARLSASSAPLARAVGLAGQIRLGSPIPLATIAAASPALFSSNAQDHLSAAICSYTSTAGNSISSLGSLAKSGYSASVQYCALHALREIHTKEALPYLTPFLDSASVKLQYEAVAGIASFANGLPVQTASNTANMTLMTAPTSAPLATNETRKNFPTQRAFESQTQTYISFWKNWLSVHMVN